MQVKFLPVDAFTQFKRDNTQTIKELRQIIQKQESEIKRLQQQINQILQNQTSQNASPQSHSSQSQQHPDQQLQRQEIDDLKKELIEYRHFMNVLKLKNLYNGFNQQTSNRMQNQKSNHQSEIKEQSQKKTFKILDTTLLSLPNEESIISIQEQLNKRKSDLNIPNDCTIVYQPVGKNLQFEQKNPDTICQYSSFSKDVQICGEYIIFNTIDPVMLYLKTIDCKTLNVNVKPILVMFYKDKLEVLDKKYLGQTWYKLNNFTLDECFDNQSNVSTHVLEISLSKFDPTQIETIRNIFPNLRFVYNGFNVEYVGPEKKY